MKIETDKDDKWSRSVCGFLVLIGSKTEPITDVDWPESPEASHRLHGDAARLVRLLQ